MKHHGSSQTKLAQRGWRQIGLGQETQELVDGVKSGKVASQRRPLPKLVRDFGLKEEVEEHRAYGAGENQHSEISQEGSVCQSVSCAGPHGLGFVRLNLRGRDGADPQ